MAAAAPPVSAAAKAASAQGAQSIHVETPQGDQSVQARIVLPGGEERNVRVLVRHPNREMEVERKERMSRQVRLLLDQSHKANDKQVKHESVKGEKFKAKPQANAHVKGRNLVIQGQGFQPCALGKRRG